MNQTDETISGEAGNFPDKVFCQTQTAHGHFDGSGTFWNVMACLEVNSKFATYYM